MSIHAPSVILMGSPGSGKTWALVTLLKAGLELFVVVTEPNGAETLIDACVREKVDLKKLHIRHHSPASPGWTALMEQAKTVSAMSYAQIQDIKAGIDKAHTKQYSALLELIANFRDDAGNAFGDVTEWSDDRAFVIDSLTGLNSIIMEQTVGMKPAIHQGEWGVAMNMQLALLRKLTADTKCFFVVTAHLDKEMNLTTGQNEVTVSALGKKNAEPIIGYFSEVVLTKRVGTNFQWSTAELTPATTKARRLALKADLPPSFQPIVDGYRAAKQALSIASGSAPKT